MTKTEMVKKLGETWGEASNRAAADKLDSFVEFVTKTVKKDKELKIPNLGTFRLRQLKRRKGRNPQTGEQITIPARKKVPSRRQKCLRNLFSDQQERRQQRKQRQRKSPARNAPDNS